jgi:hypothetical protein
LSKYLAVKFTAQQKLTLASNSGWPHLYRRTGSF